MYIRMIILIVLARPTIDVCVTVLNFLILNEIISLLSIVKGISRTLKIYFCNITVTNLFNPSHSHLLLKM
jgi:hypothetical protein